MSQKTWVSQESPFNLIHRSLEIKHIVFALIAVATISAPTARGSQLDRSQTVMATSFPGENIGSKINAACQMLGSSGGIVVVPGNQEYRFSTTIAPGDGCIVTGEGTEATRMLWTGKGAAITAENRTRVRLRSLRLTTNTAGGTAIKIAGC